MKKCLLHLAVILSLAIPAVYAQEEEIENPVVQEAVDRFRANDFDGALAMLLGELQQSPDDAEVHNALAIVYMRQEEVDKSLEHFNRAIELRPRYFKSINNKFSFLVSLNRHSEALEFMSEVTSRNPDYALGWHNKAALEMQMRQLDTALESINKAQELMPDDPVPLFKRGQIYLLLRDYDQAERDFQRVLELTPSFSQAAEGLKMIETTREKLAEGHIRVRQILVRDKALAERLHSELEAGADFIDLAVEYSQDTSARFGGDLGLVKKGGLIAVLEEAMFALAPGEISDVVESPAGYHIFLREE